MKIVEHSKNQSKTMEHIENPKKMERDQKTWYPPARLGRRIQAKVERKTRAKTGSEGKQRRQEWRQSKEGSKVTFTDVECLFMKLMKGANEEGIGFFWAIWNVMIAQEFTTTR